MSLVAQVITVPKQPPLSAAELEMARRKSQEALDRTRGVDGWLGSVTLASEGVPKLALTFWRDAAACQANMAANPDAIEHARKHGLLDQADVCDLVAGQFAGSPPTEDGTLAEVISVTRTVQPSDDELAQQRQASQEAMDANANRDGCVGAVFVNRSNAPSLAINFWRDTSALQANAASSESLLAEARRAYPTMQISDPEVLEVFASARP